MLNQSRYNVLVKDAQAGEHLLYNTANGAFAVLDDAGLAVLEARGGAEAIGAVSSVAANAGAVASAAVASVASPAAGAIAAAGSLAAAMGQDVAEAAAALAAELEAAGFLTQLTPDEEREAIRARFEGQRADASELMLVLAPTYACNYRCPYCYELGHNQIKGVMTDEVIEAVYRFVEERYADFPFTRMRVQWYGGDPSLALDTVERMSGHFMAWCEERGISYSAMMLTNCNLIDEDAVDMLSRCGLTDVFITIDGLEQTHNARRVAANGSNSFERNVNAAKLFARAGIGVHANMNADRVNWPEFAELREYLAAEAGVDLTFGRLCDYGRFFGTRDFKKPAFDLFDHEEFCRLKHEDFASRPLNAAMVQATLAPAGRFCNGQRDNYFVIDTIGDVYLCDGWIGESEHVAFNLLDGATEAQLHAVSHDPFASAQCSECRILPLCLGNCDWERRCGNMECHPFLATLPDYLRDYRSCFGKASGPFTLLAGPLL